MVDGKESIRLPDPEWLRSSTWNSPVTPGSISCSAAACSERLRTLGRCWPQWPGYCASGGGGSDGTLDPIISPDGEHVAYVAQIARDKQALIVDGKDAGYFGGHLQFTADSQHLISVSNSP